MKTSAPLIPASGAAPGAWPLATTRRRWLGTLLLGGWCCTSAAALPAPATSPDSLLPPSGRPVIGLRARLNAPKTAESRQLLWATGTPAPVGRPDDKPAPAQSAVMSAGLPQDEPAKWHRRIAQELHERVRLGFATGVMPLRGSTAEVNLTFGAPGSGFQGEGQSRVAAPALVQWYGTVYQVRVLAPLTVHLATRRVLGNWKGRGWEAGATYEYNLRPEHRPLLLRAGLAYSQQRVRYGFGTFANPEKRLNLDGTRLRADQLAVSLQQRTRALMPQLGLGVVFSPRYELVADLGWQLLRRSSPELHVAEKSGSILTRRADDVPLAKAGAVVMVDGAPAPPPWQLGNAMLSVGLIYRLN